MSNETAITRVEGTALAAYGEREQVGEIVDRLMKLHPAADEVGIGGMRAAAQLAVLVGASPLPATNEIHIWKSGNRVMIDLGINFFRRKRDEEGGVLWAIQPRPMRNDERQDYGIANGQLAAICRGIRAQDMIKYLQMGFKANQVWDMASSTGIGVCGVNEAKNGRPAIWTAFKRAEKDLYRQLYPTMMGGIYQAMSNRDVIEVDPHRFDSKSLDELNADLYGPAPVEIDYDAVEGDFQETQSLVDGTLAPFDWEVQAIESETLDGFCYSIYQLHADAPVQVFKDAAEVKRGYKFMFGEFDPARNQMATDGLRKYVNAVADGGAKKEAAAIVRAWFELETASTEPEQPSLDGSQG